MNRLQKISAASLLLVCASGGAAVAAENGVLNYPPGAPGVFIGTFPPIPGIFMLSQTNYSSGDGLYDGHGNKLPIPFAVSSISETARILVSYPTEFLGAHVYTQFVLPFVHVQSSNPGGKFSADGFAGLTISPVIMQWHLSQYQSLTLGLDIATNTGTYSPWAGLNVGTNYNTIMPTLAYRYFDPKGVEIGISPRLMFNDANTASPNVFTRTLQNYRSGDAFNVDFNVGYNFGPWKASVVGAYTQQFTDDTVNGVKAFNAAGVQDGNRLRTFAAGPSLTYDAGKFQVNVNYQHTFLVENGTKSESVWANIAFPIWVPAPPPGSGPPGSPVRH
ncbi:SphA family protein [Bradyrhizobium sp. UFLA05-112]